jgi:signal transduction histidine kinase/ligand-binding sensor domain-containing protein
MSTLEKELGRSAVRAGTLNLSQFLPLCFLLFFAVNSVFALDPHRRITQFGHTAWRVQDGLIDSSVAVTQTADGYIWIAARSGLFRYDGVTFSPWVPPNGQRMGTGTSLLGAPDGSLWIGTTSGLYRWKNGELQTYTNEPGRSGISAILQDHTGAIWVTRYRVPEREGPLCRVEGSGLHCYGKNDGIPVRYGLGLAEDSLGNLWMGSSALCRWRPGSTASTYFGDVIERLKAGNGTVDVAVGPSGSVWATLDGVGPELGVRHYSEGKWESYVVPGFDGATIRSSTLFMDRNKSLWIGTENKGLYHIHDGASDHYGSADGLSGDSVGFVYEDREGNLWVATDGGLDLFRDTPVVSFSTVEGLSAANMHSVVALRNGSVWLGNAGAVDILNAGKTSPLSVGHAFPGHDIGTMFEDHTGGMWLGLDENTRLMTYQQGQSHEIRAPDGSALGSDGAILGITEDAQHNVWVLTLGREHQLFRITDQKVRETVPLGKDLSRPAHLVADREDGIWVVSKEGMNRLRDGRFQKSSFGHTESSFNVLGSFVDSDNSLWVATTVGVFRWNNGRLNVIDASNGLPCITVFSAIKDNSGSLWLAARCGFLKIEASELKKWNDRPDSHLAIKMFDALDGAHPGSASILQPAVSKTPDGRLWFTNGKQAQMIDPDHSYINNVSPPVYIEEIVANHKSYQPQEHLHLPALTNELQIDYTALSFSVPRRVRFRYRLEGEHDAHWEEPGTRRQAFYSDLGPGKYQFRVVASNNDGVWNDIGSTLDFSIAPAWYQTYLFRILCVITGVLAVWTFYRFRMRQIAKTISVSFDQRLAERIRLARELHDTLLQTIEGSKMVADDALDQPTDPVRTRRALEQLSEWQGQAMREVRTALNSLRSSTTQVNDLAGGLQRATEDCLLKGSMRVRFSVSGTVADMHPIVRDEIYRIGYEAIRNADIHSKASLLEVELTYARDLSMRIRDNGVGIDPLIAGQGREGHFGLQGMRERALRIGGTLTIVSSANTGTELTLLVPGDIVFRRSRAAPFKKTRSLFSRTVQTSKLE